MLLHWQAVSQPLDNQRSPPYFFFFLMRFCVCKHGFCKHHLWGGSDPPSWGGMGLSGPGRGPHSCLIPAGLRGGLGGQAGSGKRVEPVAVAHPGPEGAQGLAGGDPAYSGQLPATSWNLEKGTASSGSARPWALWGWGGGAWKWDVKEVACSYGPCGKASPAAP